MLMPSSLKTHIVKLKLYTIEYDLGFITLLKHKTTKV